LERRKKNKKCLGGPKRRGGESDIEQTIKKRLPVREGGVCRNRKRGHQKQEKLWEGGRSALKGWLQGADLEKGGARKGC